MLKGRCRSVDQAGRGLSGPPAPLVALRVGISGSPLLLLPALRSGSWFVTFLYLFCSFVLYLIFIICPNWACVQLFLVLCSFFLICCWRRLCLGISTPVKGPRCLSHIHKNFLMVILFRSFTSFLFCYLDLLCSESDELELLLLVCFCFSLHVLVSALLGNKNNNNKPQWLLLWWVVVSVASSLWTVSFTVTKCPRLI